ncbi:MAG: HAMP domain-containing histidine kinase [Elusimicrobia bacterium]|nr:HAMP domain-containing histidine kinase [Elusimicrobiota bacterium]
MSAHERLAELKDKLDAKTRLMQDVAHELKNPLTVIHGYAHYLMKEQVTDETRKCLRAMLSNAERLIGLVEQLQDAVRLESSEGFKIEPQVVEGSALLQDAVESAELEAARLGIRLRWRSPIGDSLHVTADARRILQVLSNLIGNALKFTPEGGTIDVNAQRDGQFVRFSVIDSGRGIAAEEMAMLFDRFYQTADNVQRREGLGLGLAICKGLVTAHGGRIWAESLTGVGSAFNFTLPAVLTPSSSPR